MWFDFKGSSRERSWIKSVAVALLKLRGLLELFENPTFLVTHISFFQKSPKYPDFWGLGPNSLVFDEK